MSTIRQILQLRKYTWTISPTATVFDALRLMADKDVGALPVMEDDKLVGMITERDYARKVVLLGKASKVTLVSEIMKTENPTVHPDQTIQECMELMTSQRVRHLPVMEEDHLVGIISIGDVVNDIIYTQRKKIRGFEGIKLTSLLL